MRKGDRGRRNVGTRPLQKCHVTPWFPSPHSMRSGARLERTPRPHPRPSIRDPEPRGGFYLVLLGVEDLLTSGLRDRDLLNTRTHLPRVHSFR